MRRLSTILAAAALACGPAPETADSDYTGRMAIEHAGDAPVSSGMAERAPGAEVEGVTVRYATVDGKAISGYLARPADAEGPLSALVVLSGDGSAQGRLGGRDREPGLPAHLAVE